MYWNRATLCCQEARVMIMECDPTPTAPCRCGMEALVYLTLGAHCGTSLAQPLVPAL